MVVYFKHFLLTLKDKDMEVILENGESSIIKALDYNSNSKVLVVEFKTGSKYKYLNVDKNKFMEILSADSLGSKFNKIKAELEYEKIC